MKQPAAAEWVAAAPARRAALPAAAAVLSAAEILHHASVSGTTTGFAAAAVTALTYAGTPGRRTAALTGIGAAWFTIAEAAGPLAGGPWHPLLITWAAGTIAGALVLRQCESIREAREWRQAKADWLGRGPWYGLGNTHLLAHEHTRLGESWLVDVTGTGRRASSFLPGDLTERIAEREKLPVSRVRVTSGGIAGRIRISVRHRDPWAEPVEHPVLADEPELELPVPCSVHDPLPVGIDPETGAALLLPVWHKRGARNILIVGIKEAGKTVLQNCIRERLTAAADALLMDINASKAREDAEWAPACDLTAIGAAQRKRALGILRITRAIIDWRGVQPRDTAVFQPTAQSPLIVVNIDEIDALIDAGDYLAAAIKKELAYIASKGRSEAVCLIIAGQRATADWIGGADVRANIDLVCVGKVARAGEARHAGDAALALPDMATYGAGQPGVWGIAELGGAHQLGRTFNLESPVDLRRLAHERAESQPSLEPALAEHLGALYAQLKGWDTTASAPAPAAQTAEANGSYPLVTDPSPVAVIEESPLDVLDAEMNDVLPPELRDRLRRMDEKAADTRRILAETGRIMDSLPETGPAARAASSKERWKQLSEQTEIPPDIRTRILDLLAGGGLSASRIAEEIPGTTRVKIIAYLNRMRHDGEVETTGKGRGARWILAGNSESGDSQ